MSPDEIKAVLQAAFDRCDVASCPLSDMQKGILLQILEQIKGSQTGVSDSANPLDELTKQELQAFLEFFKAQEQQDGSWKAQLLNDWLNENDSGAVQFIRDRYGLSWLNRIEPYHFDKYFTKDVLKLKVGDAPAGSLTIGDRIEICNALWEWVQDNGPCTPEWYPCIVINVNQISDGDSSSTDCIVRFYNGAEFEIQGMYEWNRVHWRRGS
ncbi:hypothetical protein [Brasilonema octagenarum]|uniref:Uncharacterized protein n=1 Tax=Brasilonema octagenarum UFV-OR1 TaxID=417115 RepID=A0ABX1M3X8_9CYAN|nr:hypothetical protein [Brasilonema octagenarum]NMF63197.1 hypothetical protein [Brasilonema octagenarum UFV-OR1]